eukprot:3762386-Amphidinium_carterae.1
MTDKLLQVVYKCIAGTWKTSPLAALSIQTPLTFCGTTLIMTKSEVVLHQHVLVQELTRQYLGSMGGRGRDTTADSELFSQLGNSDPPDPQALKELQAVLGSNLWAVTRSRPDLSYAHSLAASALVHSESETRERVKHMLQYLSKHPDLGIHYAFEDNIEGKDEILSYSEASFSPRGKFSQSGYAVFWGTPHSKCLFGWGSPKQTLIAESSMEAKLLALSAGYRLAMVISMTVQEMGWNVIPSVVRMCDNQSTIAVLNEEGSKSHEWRLWGMQPH